MKKRQEDNEMEIEMPDMPRIRDFGAGWLLLVIFIGLINLAILAGIGYVIWKLLEYVGIV